MKNLFELKNARRVLVEGNLMEYVWQEAQVGYAILLTPRNQDGRAPWVTVEDVTIRRNLVRHAGGGDADHRRGLQPSERLDPAREDRRQPVLRRRRTDVGGHRAPSC